MRVFGMIFVFLGFVGYVLEGLIRVFLKVNVLRFGIWGYFNSIYCCIYFLDFIDRFFKVSKFYMKGCMEKDFI